MNPETPDAVQANTEYFFRLLYECFHGGCYGDFSLAWLADVWVWITVIGYFLSVVALFVIVYATVRLFDLRKREKEYYETLITVPGAEGEAHPRWEHIQSLVNGPTPSEWREAITEADILLDETLTNQGYVGEGVGEKLKSADRLTFARLDDAWEAHKVRNRIAHEGSAFDVTESLARRTIARYESVFREFKAI